MLAITVSLLFGLAALAAVAVIRSSLLVGLARMRAILAELAEIDRRAGVTRAPSGGCRLQSALSPACAVA